MSTYIKNCRRCSTCKYFKSKKAEGKGHPLGLCKRDNISVTPVYIACDYWEQPRTLTNKNTKKCGTCMHFTNESECAFHVICTYRTTSCIEYVKKEKETVTNPKVSEPSADSDIIAKNDYCSTIPNSIPDSNINT